MVAQPSPALTRAQVATLITLMCSLGADATGAGQGVGCGGTCGGGVCESSKRTRRLDMQVSFLGELARTGAAVEAWVLRLRGEREGLVGYDQE
jgi:hypothetical protein